MMKIMLIRARMAFKLARVLREKGIVVIIGPRSLPGVEYSSAERQGKPVPLEGVLQALYFKDGKTLQIRDLLTGQERSMDFADDWEEKIWENL